MDVDRVNEQCANIQIIDDNDEEVIVVEDGG